jgi:Fur family ferric uptake transcriptional regulator
MNRPRREISEDYCRERLHRAGLPITASRVAVLRLIYASSAPLSHAEAAERLRGQGFDRGTVYRKLLELTRAGLLFRSELGDHVWRFESRDAHGEHVDDHPHFLCIDCGNVLCLPQQSVTIGLPARVKAGVIGELSGILLKGRCRDCVIRRPE